MYQKATRTDLGKTVSKFGFPSQISKSKVLQRLRMRTIKHTCPKMDADVYLHFSSSTCNETESSSSVEATSEDDEIARKRARYACTFRPESSVLLYDSMYRVCCVYINVVVVFSSDLGIFEYFDIRILGR